MCVVVVFLYLVYLYELEVGCEKCVFVVFVIVCEMWWLIVEW